MPTAPDRGRQRGHPLGMGQRRGNPRHRPNPPGARPRTTCPHRGQDHRTRNRRVSAQPPRRPGHPTHAGPASIPTAPGFLRRHPHDRGTHRKPGQRSRFHHQHPQGPRIGQPSTAHHRIDLHQRTMQRLPRRARTTHPPQHPATPTRNRPTTPTPTPRPHDHPGRRGHQRPPMARQSDQRPRGNPVEGITSPPPESLGRRRSRLAQLER